ncbi:hypothetical protein [Pseudoteredinibacter isoporae]|uniref:Uncharacterized protein n=1 Tax=Pseudoteredinibacter isoporae TaxID=570281 RepID=A0A7X0JWU9_9GAMM|nr:hypothetical protein [Pseudoteredinibacter isoporae]MBB6523163.1 hypothetical protein [Pseudoteredinibacter isoporae]NHO88682.1 hypothetical protein [Pseudoteredinibacter isoporae]NIB22627.1 hypothetical protein [Pseudoteredinibacter isoporae]
MSSEHSIVMLKRRWKDNPGDEQLIGDVFSHYLGGKRLKEASLFEEELSRSLGRVIQGYAFESKWIHAEALLQYGFFREALAVYSSLKAYDQSRAGIGLATAHFNMGYFDLAYIEISSIYTSDASEKVQLLHLKVLYYLAQFQAVQNFIGNIRDSGVSIGGELKAFIAMVTQSDEFIEWKCRA